MSINISSEDSSCDLPDIGISSSANQDSQPRSHFTNQNDLTLGMKMKTNGSIDLTQDMICGYQDEPLVLSGSSTRSPKANGRERSNSIHSDSTIELNPNEIDTDTIFDQIILNDSIRKSSKSDHLPLSTCVSGSSTASVPLRKSVSLKPCGSGVSLQSASSSGYGSNGSRRRKSLDSIESSKSTKSLEKAYKRQKLAEERAAKQAASELNAIYKPGECLKHMIIEGHPKLLTSWYMANLQTEAVSSGVKVQQDPQLFDPGVVVFSRRRPQTLTGSDGQLTLTNPNEACNQALLIQTADEIAPYVQNHTLASRVAEVNEILGRKLSLVVFGVKDYLKSTGRKKNGKFTEIELEMAFTDLLVSSDCDSIAANTASELAITVLQFTKAVAEAPHKLAKRACDEQAEFYMRGDNKKCVSVDKDGNGLSRLWQQMLATLPNSSLEVSRALCAKYKSPLELYEELQSSGVSGVANVGVERAGVPGAKCRKVGPGFARKLKTLFTATDGDTVIL